MYGIKNINLDMLGNIELVQICIGLTQLILRFEDSTEILIESSVSLTKNNGEIIVTDELPFAGSAIADLVGLKIQDIKAEVDRGMGQVSIQFENGETFIMYDSNQTSESFSIYPSDGSEIIV